ncbi:sensor histidine kinase [Octadecabacter sp. G9-8]|uniref:histidine kinase n=1 Tax=Octadecabacter dasysiphoniae TaxID=2909341 RepID=A0ABS9CXV0_9RHOB|nr:sensor histidine kinase [Octadecabacter dasysiphoniae]MCF2872080.1 sensor histidine kinase [Octadecabacter dasysiphoniae]
MTGDVVVSRSLRNRLAMILTGGAAVLAIVLFLVVRAYAAQIAQQGQDNILNASVSSILDAAVLRDGEVELDFPYAALSMLSTDADDRVFYAVYEDGALLSGYDGLDTQDDEAFRSMNYDGSTVRIATATRTLVGANVPRRVTVSVAQTQDALSGTLNRISTNVAVFGAGFFALATVLSFWATSTTIGQLRRLTTSVTRRGPQDLSPFTKPVPTEMGPLVGSLNNLMFRLDQSLKQSEEFIAEAAHRVRTPLATVRSYAEATFQRVENTENRDALRSMMRAIDESSRAAGQLLDHAMVTFRAENLDRIDVDLNDLLRDLVQRMTPVADMRDVDFILDAAAPAHLHGDPILLQNAFRNLIDNALKYAPADSIVTVRVQTAPDLSVSVTDQGKGFPPSEINKLADRFVRGSDTDGQIGSGLGLTIARDVAAAHGGALILSNRSEGGACATLQF